jgi:hypothetical protein
MAGLYMGTKGKYVVNLNRPAGYGDWKMALHYYLFTPDGYVYRSYDAPPVPGKNDPGNSGRFTVKDGKLYLRMGPQRAEVVSAAPPQGGRLTIDSILYVRQ